MIADPALVTEVPVRHFWNFRWRGGRAVIDENRVRDDVRRVGPNDLDPDGQPAAGEADGRGRRGQPGERRERDPEDEVEVGARARRCREDAVEEVRRVVVRESRHEGGGHQKGVVGRK